MDLNRRGKKWVLHGDHRLSDYGNDKIQFKIIIIHIDCHKIQSDDLATRKQSTDVFFIPF